MAYKSPTPYKLDDPEDIFFPERNHIKDFLSRNRAIKEWKYQNPHTNRMERVFPCLEKKGVKADVDWELGVRKVMFIMLVTLWGGEFHVRFADVETRINEAAYRSGLLKGGAKVMDGEEHEHLEDLLFLPSTYTYKMMMNFMYFQRDSFNAQLWSTQLILFQAHKKYMGMEGESGAMAKMTETLVKTALDNYEHFKKWRQEALKFSKVELDTETQLAALRATYEEKYGGIYREDETAHTQKTYQERQAAKKKAEKEGRALSEEELDRLEEPEEEDENAFSIMV